MKTTYFPSAALPDDPHANQPILTAGPPPKLARATLIVLHGRGDSAEGILSLFESIALDHLAAIAPQAAGQTWYPQSFLAPLPANQPKLNSAIKKLNTIVDGLLSQNISSEKIAILGFSQGACLATEFIARHPRRYGAVMALTGGLVGPPGTPRDYPGSLQNTPIFLGTSDPDPHVPFERVRETETVLTRLGADVMLRRYAGMPHTINQEELDLCRDYLQRLVILPSEDRS